MSEKSTPKIFSLLISEKCAEESDILRTDDGFFMIYKSLSNILLEKDVLDFPDLKGERLRCESFFDDSAEIARCKVRLAAFLNKTDSICF